MDAGATATILTEKPGLRSLPCPMPPANIPVHMMARQGEGMYKGRIVDSSASQARDAREKLNCSRLPTGEIMCRRIPHFAN